VRDIVEGQNKEHYSGTESETREVWGCPMCLGCVREFCWLSFLKHVFGLRRVHVVSVLHMLRILLFWTPLAVI
jgi:hypothetical protein